jgi:hypothetical protein
VVCSERVRDCREGERMVSAAFAACTAEAQAFR